MKLRDIPMILSIVLCAAWLALATPARAQTTRPIAVWQQPADSFGKWRARGVNTIVGTPPVNTAADVDAWCAAAKAAGVSYVLQGDALHAAHWNDAGCVGILLVPDEPNSGGPGDGSYVAPGVMLDRSIAIREKTAKPIWLSLAGWNLQYQSDAKIIGYIAACDVVSFDYYPYNRGDAAGAASVNKITDRLVKLAGGKKVIVDIEPSDQRLAPDWHGRQPTVAEMAQLVNDARARGCDIMYFSHAFSGTEGANPWTSFDGTDPEHSGAMTILNQQK